jgi:peptide/nickel transport system substrate-binding protein
MSNEDNPLRSPSRGSAVLAVALLLAACSPSASESPSAASSEPGASEIPAAPTDTLSVAFLSDIQTLDPAQGYDVVSWPAERLIFEPLLGYDEDANIVPLLAAEMPEISDDGLTFTFTLREGVNFVRSDGTIVGEMTATDVVASLNRLLNPNLLPNASPVASSFFAIIEGADEVAAGTTTEASGIQMIDERTVSITITSPNQTFLNILAMPFGSIIPADSPTTAEEITANPIGTGPFLLESREVGQRLTYVLNPHYWNPAGQRVAGIDFRVGVDPTSAFQQAQTGDLDIPGDNPPAGQVTALMDDDSLADRRFRSPLVAVMFMAMDVSGDTPLNNAQVRQAISSAIDKENLAAIAHLGQPATCILPPTMPAYDPSCEPYPYDPDHAAELMEEAGFADGFSITLYTTTNDPDPAVGAAIQQDLAAIGIEVEVIPQVFNVLLGTIVIPHEAGMVYIGWFQDFPDPADFYDPILSCATNSEGNFNLAWYCNEDIEALADQARAETDSAARLDMYEQIFNDVMEDAPWVPLLYPEQLTVTSERVTGFYHHPAWLFDFASYGIEE